MTLRGIAKRRKAAHLGLRGTFKVEHRREGKVINEFEFNNAITDAGMNALLNIMFESATQITTWFLGLIDNASFTALATADTMASHAGWIENVAYTQSTRVAWTPAASTVRASVNASAVTFSINATGIIEGIFLVNISTKSGTTGTLFSTAAFPVPVNVANGDNLNITYTISG